MVGKGVGLGRYRQCSTELREALDHKVLGLTGLIEITLEKERHYETSISFFFGAPLLEGEGGAFPSLLLTETLGLTVEVPPD